MNPRPARRRYRDDFHAEKALVQQQKSDFYAPATNNRQQSLKHLFHRVAVFDAHERQGVTVALVEHHGRGVGVEMGGARLRFAPKDFLLVQRRPSVIGDQRQVDRHHAGLASQRLGHVRHQGEIQTAFEFGDFRQRCGQGVANRLIRWGVGQIAAGGKHRNNPCRGNQENLEKRGSRTFVTLILKAKRRPQPVLGIGMDLSLGDDILRL